MNLCCLGQQRYHPISTILLSLLAILLLDIHSFNVISVSSVSASTTASTTVTVPSSQEIKIKNTFVDQPHEYAKHLIYPLLRQSRSCGGMYGNKFDLYHRRRRLAPDEDHGSYRDQINGEYRLDQIKEKQRLLQVQNKEEKKTTSEEEEKKRVDETEHQERHEEIPPYKEDGQTFPVQQNEDRPLENTLLPNPTGNEVTLVVRNLPSFMTRDDVVASLYSRGFLFGRDYDYLYVPMNCINHNVF